jgi:hypothetical protein
VRSYTNRDADEMARPEFLRHHERADRRSWREMALLQGEVFG